MRKRPLIVGIFVAALAAGCAGGASVQTMPDDPAGIDLGELWVEPRDLASRDLFYGAGGLAQAPGSSATYQIVAVDRTGFSPGYDVRDARGGDWSVKLGVEAQPEVVVSRVLWALGYHQPPTYFLPSWESGTRREPAARFRREVPGHTVVSHWSWYDNPFAASQAFKGLIVANLIVNNWDWKISNNKIYDIAESSKERRRVYVVRDLGASLGRTSFPGWLVWTPFRKMAQGSRNDLEDFESQRLIDRVDGTRIDFDYHGTNARLLDAVTADDVLWTCRLMSRLSDQQWDDAFRAAGYEESVRRRYVAKVKSKIAEGLALAGS